HWDNTVAYYEEIRAVIRDVDDPIPLLDQLLSDYNWNFWLDSENGASTTEWIDRVSSISLVSDGISLSAESPTGKPGFALDGSAQFNTSAQIAFPAGAFRVFFVVKQPTGNSPTQVLLW